MELYRLSVYRVTWLNILFTIVIKVKRPLGLAFHKDYVSTSVHLSSYIILDEPLPYGECTCNYWPTPGIVYRSSTILLNRSALSLLAATASGAWTTRLL